MFLLSVLYSVVIVSVQHLLLSYRMNDYFILMKEFYFMHETISEIKKIDNFTC